MAQLGSIRRYRERGPPHWQHTISIRNSHWYQNLLTRMSSGQTIHHISMTSTTFFTYDCLCLWACRCVHAIDVCLFSFCQVFSQYRGRKSARSVDYVLRIPQDVFTYGNDQHTQSYVHWSILTCIYCHDQSFGRPRPPCSRQISWGHGPLTGLRRG